MLKFAKIRGTFVSAEIVNKQNVPIFCDIIFSHDISKVTRNIFQKPEKVTPKNLKAAYQDLLTPLKEIQVVNRQMQNL